MAAPQLLQLESNGWVPNNPRLPVLVYRRVEPARGAEATAIAFERRFGRHRWPAGWRDGIFGYHHYHSTAHEALGVAAGSARVMLGGPGGEVVEIDAGDVLVLPAGTGHRREAASDDFLVVGAYPAGQRWDLCTSAATPAMLRRIAAVPVPAVDPAAGSAGDLPSLWRGGGAAVSAR
ncbi:cupin domain-containing protein [Luteimonas sp. RD2P54]|uniref:Cupin domain-containing protein n=1 Tax=Luteimonas endophytica TaxID=3042023 RepID=A0ABT6JAD7_9GAMM|nr:cupin domain-containing protein [Luteimonas endophytica]MDH5823148.1 cupin domain-containing protein [Luteimonas endophytica]